jgi:hypothetical protein
MTRGECALGGLSTRLASAPIVSPARVSFVFVEWALTSNSVARKAEAVVAVVEQLVLAVVLTTAEDFQLLGKNSSLF